MHKKNKRHESAVKDVVAEIIQAVQTATAKQEDDLWREIVTDPAGFGDRYGKYLAQGHRKFLNLESKKKQVERLEKKARFLLACRKGLSEDNADKLTDEDKATIIPQVFEWLKNENDPCDDDFHKWAEKAGLDVHKAEAAAYHLAKRFIELAAGGKSKGNRPDGVSDAEVVKGIEVEKEHTSDPEVARKIAYDHLTEFSDYYVALEKMEHELKAKHSGKSENCNRLHSALGRISRRGQTSLQDDSNPLQAVILAHTSRGTLYVHRDKKTLTKDKNHALQTNYSAAEDMVSAFHRGELPDALKDVEYFDAVMIESLREDTSYPMPERPETLDDILDNVLRKMIVTGSIDAIQDVDFADQTHALYLFLDATMTQEEAMGLQEVLKSIYPATSLVASPDGSLGNEPSEWWVIYVPQAEESIQSPIAQPEPIPTPSVGSTVKDIAQGVNVDAALSNLLKAESLKEGEVSGSWPKSKGHLAFLKGSFSKEPFEYYLDAAGDLWRAPVGNVIDVTNGYRIGRWEAPKHLAKRMFDQAVKDFEE